MSNALPARVVLYDGVCGFCDLSVQWLLDHDKAGAFHYAALQGATAAELRSRHPEIPADIDTVVFVDADQVYLRSAAVFRLVRYLPAPWSWARVLSIIPRFIADFGYNRFASIRYYIFGKKDACRIPKPAERALFLA